MEQLELFSNKKSKVLFKLALLCIVISFITIPFIVFTDFGLQYLTIPCAAMAVLGLCFALMAYHYDFIDPNSYPNNYGH